MKCKQRNRCNSNMMRVTSTLALATGQGGRIKMRSPPKVLTGNFRPSQLSFFLS